MMLENVSGTPKCTSSSTNRHGLGLGRGRKTEDAHKLTLLRAPPQTLTYYHAVCLQDSALQNREQEVSFLSGVTKSYEHEHLLFFPKWNSAGDTVELSGSPRTAFQVFIL